MIPYTPLETRAGRLTEKTVTQWHTAPFVSSDLSDGQEQEAMRFGSYGEKEFNQTEDTTGVDPIVMDDRRSVGGETVHGALACPCGCDDIDCLISKIPSYVDDDTNELYNRHSEELDRLYSEWTDGPCDGAWREDDDPVEELANRLDWITGGLRSGEVDVRTAIDAVDNLYVGLEDDLNALILQPGDGASDDDGGSDDEDSDASSCGCCGCGHGDGSSCGADWGDAPEDEMEIRRLLHQLRWRLCALDGVLEAAEDPKSDPYMNASKAGGLIKDIVALVVWNDGLCDALQNPRSDTDRDFNKGCLEEDLDETIGLLGHARSNYVVAYAVREWLERFGDQVIGGLDAVKDERLSLRRLDTGRLIIA